MRAFGITAAALGSLAAIYPYVFAVMALPGGSLADTLGASRTLALGATAMGLGTALFGLAPTFAVAYAGRLLVGVGASVILIAWLSLAAQWFEAREFATIAGWTQTVGNGGALVASAPLALVVEAVGWRRTFVIIGGVTLFLAVAVLGWVRDRPTARARAAPMLRPVLRSIRALVTNRKSWPPILAATGAYASLILLLGLWGVPHVTQVYGLGRVAAATDVSLLAVGMGVGAPLVGWLSDRCLGLRRLPMAAFLALYALCWIPLAFPAARVPASVLPPLFFVMGFVSAGLVLVWPSVLEVNDTEHVDAVIGVCNTPVFLGLAFLQWLTGVILDAWWTGETAAGARVYSIAAYGAAFSVCLAAAAGAAVMASRVTETRCRRVARRAADLAPTP